MTMCVPGTRIITGKRNISFPDRLIQNSTEYQKLNNKVCSYFAAFDANAKDSARIMGLN